MLMQMIDCLIEQDPSLSARRTIDMRRYIVNRWNRTHEEPIDEDGVALFLCDENRGNLTDDQIKAIAAKGGVVQVCLYNWFLSKQPNPTILDAVAHINHIVQLVGIDHVGIGTDFDGDDTEKLTGCRAANEVINLTVELLRQGYTAEELHKLWGDNLLRVLNSVQN